MLKPENTAAVRARKVAAMISTAVPPDPRQAAAAAASVRKARRDERAQVAEVLADGFYDDPVATWFYPDDARRREQLRNVFALVGERVWFDHDLTYTTDGVVGAAIWVPPGKWHLGMVDQLRLLPGMAAAVGWRALGRTLRGLNLMETKHPRDHHYYLPDVAVTPAWQGKGIGTALLAPVLHLCDEEGVPAYLEATSPRNRECYERCDFRVTEEFSFPNGPPFWAMRREPQGG
jgi:GNAT superfamily N-acetyltransferase